MQQVSVTEYVQALIDQYESGDSCGLQASTQQVRAGPTVANPGGYACNNPWTQYNYDQVLADAAAVDAAAAAGQDVTPLCGLPLAVKDAIDVEGCALP